MPSKTPIFLRAICLLIDNYMNYDVFICPDSRKKLQWQPYSNESFDGTLVSEDGFAFPVIGHIVDLIFPRCLDGAEESSRVFYEGLSLIHI